MTIRLSIISLIAFLLSACTLNKPDNYQLEREVIGQTFADVIQFSPKFPYYDPRVTLTEQTEKDSIQNEWNRKRMEDFLSSKPFGDTVSVGIVLMDSIYSSDSILNEFSGLANSQHYPDLIAEDSTWKSVLDNFKQSPKNTISLEEFKLGNFGNLHIFKQSNYKKEMPSYYLKSNFGVKFSRVVFSEDKTKACYYAEAWSTQGGMAFCEFEDNEWKLKHSAIVWIH